MDRRSFLKLAVLGILGGGATLKILFRGKRDLQVALVKGEIGQFDNVMIIDRSKGLWKFKEVDVLTQRRWSRALWSEVGRKDYMMEVLRAEAKKDIVPSEVTFSKRSWDYGNKIAEIARCQI